MVDFIDAVAQAIQKLDSTGDWPWEKLSDGTRDLYRRMARAAIDALGLTEERRVLTPQGTSRDLRPDEGELGDRLRGLGWWIESRLISGWVRKDNTNE